MLNLRCLWDSQVKIQRKQVNIFKLSLLGFYLFQFFSIFFHLANLGSWCQHSRLLKWSLIMILSGNFICRSSSELFTLEEFPKFQRNLYEPFWIFLRSGGAQYLSRNMTHGSATHEVPTKVSVVVWVI